VYSLLTRPFLFDYVRANIFLPHRHQCGLDISPKRFRQRLGIDIGTSSAFPYALDSTVSAYAPNPASTSSETDRDHPPPAHPALVNAIFLLACHFGSSASLPITLGASSVNSHLHSLNPLALKKELADAESVFLTRALRGIAAALEAGEAAATCCSSASSSASSSSSGSRWGGSDRGGWRGRSKSRSRSLSASTGFGVVGSSSMGVRDGTGIGGSGPASPVSTRSPGNGKRGHGHGQRWGGEAEGGQLDPATPLVDAVQASALLAVYFFAKVNAAPLDCMLSDNLHFIFLLRLASSKDITMPQRQRALLSPSVCTRFEQQCGRHQIRHPIPMRQIPPRTCMNLRAHRPQSRLKHLHLRMLRIGIQ
jgi:hypothetical protein